MSIADDSTAIAGKFFPAQYFYSVAASTVTTTGTNNGYSFSGAVSAGGQSGISGTAQIVNAETGQITIGGSPYVIMGSTANGQNLVLGTERTDPFGSTFSPKLILSNAGVQPVGNQNFASANSYTAPRPVCYAQGTQIRTPLGERAIETLQVGDEVLLASGNIAAIKWLGHRTVRVATSPFINDVAPIRILENAFADGSPNRDLLVSPAHSIAITCMDDIFVLADTLINGSTVVQDMSLEEITYWHIELGEHAVIIANGMRAESYIEDGNRDYFTNADAVSIDPAFVKAHRSKACLPVVTEGPVLTAIRGRLTSRARLLGWSLEQRDGESNLLVNGTLRRPLYDNHQHLVFSFDASADEVSLISETHVPASISGCDDMRTIGIMLSQITFQDEHGEKRKIAIDDPRLSGGLHKLELIGDARARWTSGHVALPREIWTGMSGTIIVALHYLAKADAFWKAAPAMNEMRLAS